MKYTCETCDYNTNNKTNYAKHLLTSKHCSLTTSDKKATKNSDTYICAKCNKTYKSRVGLWGHNKKCDKVSDDHVREPSISNEIVLSLINQNKELQNLLVEELTRLRGREPTA
jgi:hypothetical protein